MTCDDVRDLAAGFVLDALEPDEMAAVREHLETCDDPHAEIAELASAVPVLAASVPVVEPPAALGARIRAAAAADLAERDAPAVASPAPEVPASVTTLPTGEEREQRLAARRGPGVGTWLMGIAAVLAIALLGGWNLAAPGPAVECPGLRGCRLPGPRRRGPARLDDGAAHRGGRRPDGARGRRQRPEP